MIEPGKVQEGDEGPSTSPLRPHLESIMESVLATFGEFSGLSGKSCREPHAQN